MPVVETLERKPRPRRSFTLEFEAEIVEHCRRGDRSIRPVAPYTDLTETAVGARVTQVDHHARWSTSGDRNRGLMTHDRNRGHMTHEHQRVSCNGG
jgi:hypothetical protein